jgi:mRNA interferase RelE/StbE
MLSTRSLVAISSLSKTSLLVLRPGTKGEQILQGRRGPRGARTVAAELARLNERKRALTVIDIQRMSCQSTLMSQITARLPDELVKALDKAADELRQTRAEVVRTAIEHYLAEYEDLAGTRFGVTYSLQIKESASKEIRALPKGDRERVVAAIDGLRVDPHQGTQLKGSSTGLRRIRVGHYRIIFEVQKAVMIILVLRVGHRKDVYR